MLPWVPLSEPGVNDARWTWREFQQRVSNWAQQPAKLCIRGVNWMGTTEYVYVKYVCLLASFEAQDTYPTDEAGDWAGTRI